MMNFEVAQTFMINCGDKFLRELVKESKSLELYHPKKTYSTSDLDNRMNFIFVIFFNKFFHLKILSQSWNYSLINWLWAPTRPTSTTISSDSWLHYPKIPVFFPAISCLISNLNVFNLLITPLSRWWLPRNPKWLSVVSCSSESWCIKSSSVLGLSCLVSPKAASKWSNFFVKRICP